MRKKQFKTQEEFLLDMLEYYCVNPQERRSFMEGGTCQYAPTKTSEGCAIGRHLSKSLAIDMDNLEETIENIKRYEPKIFEKIPKWLRDLGIDFLRECQSLHDNETYWNNYGLSKIGKEQLTKIIVKFKLKKKSFSKYLSKNAK